MHARVHKSSKNYLPPLTRLPWILELKQSHIFLEIYRYYSLPRVWLRPLVAEEPVKTKVMLNSIV